MRYGINSIPSDAQIFEPVDIGFPSRERMRQSGFTGTIIGARAIIRSGSILYCDVEIGDDFQCGHNVIIREHTKIRDRTSIGTASVIEGHSSIGNDVNIQSMVYIPTNTTIGNRVFIGPNAVLTNDRYPPSGKPRLQGPALLDRCVIGANATILPMVTIGEGAAVAAASVVTKDVPAGKLAIGAPAKIRDLPKELIRR